MDFTNGAHPKNDAGASAPAAGVSRRDLLPQAAAGVAAMIVPRRVLGGSGFMAPSDTLVIAGVGVGGMGQNYLKGCETENIAVLCDVDDDMAAPVVKRYPNAKTYRDYRIMLEKEKGIDAVVIGTPDHTHALIGMAAMRLGKHVYCAKPMTRTIFEARAMTNAAREAKVATQMSVQSCAGEPACATAEWVQSGVIGPVRQVHVWSDRPIWPQGIERPADTPPAPPNMDWDLWLGPAPVRPFHPTYHPFSWRGWYDFGTGAIGDMACHTLHVIFSALNLGHPTTVQASSNFRYHLVAQPGRRPGPRKMNTSETWPVASIITWDFPAREGLPPVRVSWYDGGVKPPKPPEMEPERALGNDGILFVGDKGTILSGFTGGPKLVPESRNADFQPPAKTLERTVGHYIEWVAACKGGKPAHCNFNFGGLLTEVALLGTLAVKTGKQLNWDPANLRITNDEAANQLINPPYRAGWSL